MEAEAALTPSQAKISIIIPAYNEARKIQETIQAVQSISYPAQVLVVNDASQDQTSQLARASGAEVLDLPQNLGKGGALNIAIPVASGEIIALLDGDLGSSAALVEKLIQPVLAGTTDLAIARFGAARRRGGFGLVTKLARLGIRWFTGLKMISPLSGQRVFQRRLWEEVGPFESRFGVEVGLTIDAARHGFRIQEVALEMRHQETGRNLAGFIHRGRQFINVLRVLLKRLIMR